MKLQSSRSLYDTIDQVVADGVRRGLGHLSVDQTAPDGRTVHIAGRPMLNLGTASYLHLERHPALVAGATEMLQRHGTQFAASRAYVQLALYDQLEDQLGRIFGRPALVTASTTLGHLSAIPVLVDDGDAIVLDQQVHSSMQTVVQICKARGVPVHVVRHSRLDELESRIQRLRNKHRTIWFFADGIYSMFGDGAPVEGLWALMDRYPQLRCYVDDAHGFGWTGPRGCGWVRARVDHHPQLVLAVSLNKSFAGAGGALIFPTEAERQRVRNCGPTMIFSGPIQPPMLGALLGSAALHLSDALPALQEALRLRIDHCREGLVARGLPQVAPNDTPLYFVPTGMPQRVKAVAARLMDDGYCVNLGIFPAVPTSMGGIRFHVHRGLSLADIDGFLDCLAHHHRAVLAEEGVGPRDLARAFRMPHLAAVAPAAPVPARPRPPAAAGLVLHHEDDIAAVPPALWDGLFAGQGPLCHAALAALAPGFAAAPDPQARALARFVWITDADGAVVLATAYSIAHMKEDMLAGAAVSARAEARRRAGETDFLVSKVVALGLPITLGPHLHLDRAHPAWRAALRALLSRLRAAKEAHGAAKILLREFAAGADPELAQLLLDEGFVEVAMPPMMTLEGMDWQGRDGLLASLKSRYRRELRREVLPFLDRVRVVAGPVTDPETVAAARALYARVHARGAELSVFALPEAVFATMLEAPGFDTLRFEVAEAGGWRLGGVMLSHRRGDRYTALVVGFDETLVPTHAIYKVALLHTVERARALGCTSCNLAFTAEIVKRKVGARPRPTCAYALVDDTFGARVLANL